jgi:hypothetical protein
MDLKRSIPNIYIERVLYSMKNIHYCSFIGEWLLQHNFFRVTWMVRLSFEALKPEDSFVKFHFG